MDALSSPVRKQAPRRAQPLRIKTVGPDPGISFSVGVLLTKRRQSNLGLSPLQTKAKGLEGVEKGGRTGLVQPARSCSPVVA
jgi:hypothetical protein